MARSSAFFFSSHTVMAGLFMGASVGFVAPAFADTSSPNTSRTAISTETGTVGINSASEGSLLFKTDIPGRYIKAPTVDTDVKMHIAGPVIRTTLSQTFENISDTWVEGVYVFPLPENAAVDRLRIFVGGRLIEGQIQEKKQARQTYETAKKEGRKASLVEQLRPNMFSAAVANIGPRESVAIQIEYQDKIEIKHGVAALTFPMTVAPRFSPPPVTLQMASAEGNIIPVSLDPVLDRHLISPPVMRPEDEPADYLRLPVSIDIELDAGFDLEDIKSPYHDIRIDRIDSDKARITLANGPVPANRDFQLRWRAAPSAEPQQAIFTETIGDDQYLLTMMTPPQPDILTLNADDDLLPDTLTNSHKRDMIFVIDTSGSMQGTSIRQARAALKLGLSRLSPEDSFNIIRFSNTHSSLYRQSQRATSEAIGEAMRYVSGLTANGGTMMQPALSEVLGIKPDPERLRQIVFITDGAIGNETELFALIQDRLADARLFPVGIGSAPNRFFMSRAAKFGRGTVVMIGNLDEVQSRMKDLFTALEHPVLTDLQLDISGQIPSSQVESYPARLPDLYAGEPVISVTKLGAESPTRSISLSGQWADRTHKDTRIMADASSAKGLSVLWARAKIADLEERRYDRGSVDEIDAQILSTALDYHLVSRLTSLVAVDVTPSRDVSTPFITQPVPTQLPEGWEFAEAVMSTSRKARQQTANNLGADQAPPQPRNLQAQRARLPGTASPHILFMLLGGLLMAVSGLLARFKTRLSTRRHG